MPEEIRLCYAESLIFGTCAEGSFENVVLITRFKLDAA